MIAVFNELTFLKHLQSQSSAKFPNVIQIRLLAATWAESNMEDGSACVFAQRQRASVADDALLLHFGEARGRHFV